VPSPQQFTYFQGGGFDRTFLSFMQIDGNGSVNVSRLAARPHVTAGAGGFVDITARAKQLVFSGFMTAGGLDLEISDGKVTIKQEGRNRKFVPDLEHVTFSGRMARERGQRATYVTERCVIELIDGELVVVEIAPGIDLDRDILGQVDIPLRVASDLKLMDARLFDPDPMGLHLEVKPRRLVPERFVSQNAGVPAS
jgi:propionate CoA-transferase